MHRKFCARTGGRNCHVSNYMARDQIAVQTRFFKEKAPGHQTSVCRENYVFILKFPQKHFRKFE